MTAGTVRGTYLERILTNTRQEVDRRMRARPLRDIEQAVQNMPAALSLTKALRRTGVAIIAEVKRASPSKGPIADDAVAADVARDYLAGGAAAISVLTDERYFNGSLEDLTSVALVAHGDARPAPVLRKDFVIDPYQIVEARAAGADAVLLIVAALSDEQLHTLHTAAHELGIDALVEVHDEAELERALDAGARLIGVNSRNLRTFEVDLATIERVVQQAPDDVVLVGESGIRTPEDIERLGRAGVHAVLVGETLMRAADRAAAVRELLG